MRPVLLVWERAAVVWRVAVASLGLSLRDDFFFFWLDFAIVSLFDFSMAGAVAATLDCWGEFGFAIKKMI